jgi:hypothetical protein
MREHDGKQELGIALSDLDDDARAELDTYLELMES